MGSRSASKNFRNNINDYIPPLKVVEVYQIKASIGGGGSGIDFLITQFFHTGLILNVKVEPTQQKMERDMN